MEKEININLCPGNKNQQKIVMNNVYNLCVPLAPSFQSNGTMFRKSKATVLNKKICTSPFYHKDPLDATSTTHSPPLTALQLTLPPLPLTHPHSLSPGPSVTRAVC